MIDLFHHEYDMLIPIFSFATLRNHKFQTRMLFKVTHYYIKFIQFDLPVECDPDKTQNCRLEIVVESIGTKPGPLLINNWLVFDKRISLR